MAFLVWQDDLDTGIGVIDAQHRRLVEMINRLHGARSGLGREVVGEVIDELVDYTLFHFTFEEALLDDAGYPLSDAHKRIHALFTARVADYRARFQTGEDVAGELVQVLSHWLFSHIRSDDAAYVETVGRSLPGPSCKAHPQA